MVVLMNILAWLFILAVIGFVVAIATLAGAGLSIYRKVKGAKGLIEQPKQAVLQIASTGKGIAQRDMVRLRTIAGVGRVALQRGKATQAAIFASARSVDTGGAAEAASQAKSAVANLISTATLGLNMAQRMLDIAAQFRRQNGNH